MEFEHSEFVVTILGRNYHPRQSNILHNLFLEIVPFMRNFMSRNEIKVQSYFFRFLHHLLFIFYSIII